jgi:putative DNA primase/helicase
MNDKAEDLAYGHWPEILQRAGIGETFFNPRRNGPCPFCGGKDRYRWRDKNGGAWLCRQCPESGGRWTSGFTMLMKHMGYARFHDAADHVREHFNGSASGGITRAPTRAALNETSQVDHERNMRRMVAIWEASRAISLDDPVDQYLKRRVPGLNFTPQWVRYHPALDYWAPPESPEDRPVLIGRFPAMVAKALDPKGAFVQIHKTYLTKDGFKADVPVVKKTERGVGVNGFAVAMMPVLGDTLGFAEGIESALAAAMVRHIPVWPCLNGPSMAAFDVPETLLEQINRIVIFADHDELKTLSPANPSGVRRLRSAGSYYAEQLAMRARSRGKRVLVMKANRVGCDMADFWEEHQVETMEA